MRLLKSATLVTVNDGFGLWHHVTCRDFSLTGGRA